MILHVAYKEKDFLLFPYFPYGFSGVAFPSCGCDQKTMKIKIDFNGFAYYKKKVGI